MAYKQSPIGKKKCPYSPMQKRGLISDAPIMLDGNTVSSSGKRPDIEIDRPAIQFAAKELCREMSTQAVQAWTGLDRQRRYVIGNPSVVHQFYRRGGQDMVSAWTDTAYDGCLRTSRSTSGGRVNMGNTRGNLEFHAESGTIIGGRSTILWHC